MYNLDNVTPTLILFKNKTKQRTFFHIIDYYYIITIPLLLLYSPTFFRLSSAESQLAAVLYFVFI